MQNINRKYFNIAGIYLIKDSIKEKVYVGSSCNLYKRINKHIRDLLKNKHHTAHLQHHYNKYGDNCLSVEIVETLEKTLNYREILFQKEQEYLNLYKDVCFNSHHEVSFLLQNVEFYKKHSSFMKLWWKDNKNEKVLVVLENLNIAKLNVSKRWEKIRNGEIEYVNPNFGKKTSNETKSKQSVSALKRGRYTFNLKKVYQYDLEGNFIKEWETAKDAAREVLNNCKLSANIYCCANGKRKHVGQFIWRLDKIDKIVINTKFKIHKK